MQRKKKEKKKVYSRSHEMVVHNVNMDPEKILKYLLKP